MRIQAINLTNDGVQVTYLEEDGIHTDTGIIEARVLDIPHAMVPNDLLDDLVDSVRSVIEHARVARRQPVDSFTAPR